MELIRKVRISPTTAASKSLIGHTRSGWAKMAPNSDCQAWSTRPSNYSGCPPHRLGAQSIDQVKSSPIEEKTHLNSIQSNSLNRIHLNSIKITRTQPISSRSISLCVQNQWRCESQPASIRRLSSVCSAHSATWRTLPMTSTARPVRRWIRSTSVRCGRDGNGSDTDHIICSSYAHSSQTNRRR